MRKNLVVGIGFSGAVIANLIAENLKEEVILIDKKDHIAGNCFDYLDKNGIMIHKYGSHIFHTSNDEVWKYLNRFSNFNQYMHKVHAIIDGIETTIPFNFNTIYDVFPKTMAEQIELKLLKKFEYNSKIPILEFQNQKDKLLKFLADFIFEKVYAQYTIKQWGLNPKDIDKTVTARIPIYLSKDNRYFQDKYQGIPCDGYTKLISNMLDNKNIKIELNTDYKNIDKNFNRIFYTGSIDEYFNFEFGQLEYRSVNFKLEEYNMEFYQKNSVVNYPCNYDFTRIHEYKHYLKNKSDKTVIAKEYSENFQLGKNERFYPILKKENITLYKKYLKRAKTLKNTYFLGRLGDYQYYDMDKAIYRAMEVFNNINK